PRLWGYSGQMTLSAYDSGVTCCRVICLDQLVRAMTPTPMFIFLFFQKCIRDRLGAMRAQLLETLGLSATQIAALTEAGVVGPVN
ncbi:hypothetical protein, partial [Achromobacter ruhlandii]|uniref:hypothetical protein n=1 Tax=Achromobacter ruhlandii TaxID=72557 RepID=UPI001B8C40FA